MSQFVLTADLAPVELKRGPRKVTHMQSPEKSERCD